MTAETYRMTDAELMTEIDECEAGISLGYERNLHICISMLQCRVNALRDEAYARQLDAVSTDYTGLHVAARKDEPVPPLERAERQLDELRAMHRAGKLNADHLLLARYAAEVVASRKSQRATAERERAIAAMLGAGGGKGAA